jgi:ATP-dependent Clp protease protease subunit
MTPEPKMRRNNLLQLLADNRRPYTPMAQRMQRNAAGNEVTLYLYDPIVEDRWMAEMFGGVCPQDFVPAVRAIDAEQIHLRVNCPGGDVFAAEAMCEALREHPAKVHAHIEGLAASAATAITCACDRVLATSGSKFMIHETWTIGMGSKSEFRRLADLLEKADETMLQEYHRRSGNSLDQLRAWIEAETWFTADEARNAGFVDEVKTSASRAQARADARPWALSAYAKGADVVVPADMPGQDNTEPTTPAAPLVDEDTRSRQRQRVRVASLLLPVV